MILRLAIYGLAIRVFCIVHWLRYLHSALHAFMVQSNRRSLISEALRGLQTHLIIAILVGQFE